MIRADRYHSSVHSRYAPKTNFHHTLHEQLSPRFTIPAMAENFRSKCCSALTTAISRVAVLVLDGPEQGKRCHEDDMLWALIRFSFFGKVRLILLAQEFFQ